METKVPTVRELIEGGSRSEHVLAVAMADASPKLLASCRAAISFLESISVSSARDALIAQRRGAADVSRAIG